MAFSGLFDAIKAKLPPSLQPRTFLGAKHLSRQDNPPRVVFVQTRDRYTDPATIGADPRQLWTRASGVEVHVWGATADDAEELARQVQVAIHQVAVGAYKLHEGEWRDQLGAEAGSVTNKGERYVFLFTVDVPVTETPYTTGVVTDIPETGVLQVGTPPTDSPG